MSRKPVQPEPSPEELARRRADMLAWLREQRRRGAVMVTVTCLSNHRIETSHERTA